MIELDGEPAVRETAAQPRVVLQPTSKTVPTPSPATLLQAQANTADWITELGLDDAAVLNAIEKEQARNSFVALTTGQTPEQQTTSLLALTAPEQVQHLVGMLTAYDWEFVTQAKEIRGYVVAKLIQEAEGASKSGDRIKALTALGKVTEVGLFTEKVEIKKTEQTDEELDQRIKDRLAKLRGVVDALAPPADIEDSLAKPDQPDA